MPLPTLLRLARLLTKALVATVIITVAAALFGVVSLLPTS